MDFRRDESTRTVRAPAKLNLHLEILGRRDDDYHELETLMVPVTLWDSLSLTSVPPIDDRPGGVVLKVCSASSKLPPSEVDVPQGQANFVVRALELLRERSGCQAGAHAVLVKRIPAAAGLGGGSSDAAAALRLGNGVWQLGWSTDQLAELGAELGSDVPFFVYGRPAVCRGRGERIERLAGSRRFYAVVVQPPFGLRTPDVFTAHDSLAPRAALNSSERLIDTIRALRRGDWPALGRSLSNRLEAAAATLSPWIARARAVFQRLGCMGHQLSGSGSAYFGICSHAAQAERLSAILRTRQLGMVYTVRSCT